MKNKIAQLKKEYKEKYGKFSEEEILMEFVDEYTLCVLKEVYGNIDMEHDYFRSPRTDSILIAIQSFLEQKYEDLAEELKEYLAEIQNFRYHMSQNTKNFNIQDIIKATNCLNKILLIVQKSIDRINCEKSESKAKREKNDKQQDKKIVISKINAQYNSINCQSKGVLLSEKINLLVKGLIAEAENEISQKKRNKFDEFLHYDLKDPKRWLFYDKKNKIISRLKFIIRKDNALYSIIDYDGANYNSTARENVVSAVHKQLEKIYDITNKKENLLMFDDKCLEEMKKDICIAKSMKQSNNSKSKISNQNLSKKSII